MDRVFHHDFMRDLMERLTGRHGLAVVSRNFLFLIIGALAVVTALLGYRYYEEHKKTSGIQIDIGKGGVSIEEK